MITESRIENAKTAHWKPQKKPVLRHFIVYFVPLFLAITLVLAGLLIGDYFRTSSLINANEKLQIDIIKKTLARDLIDVGPDLRILLQSNSFQEYLATPSSRTTKNLQDAFSVFANQRRLYDQIRFIDTQGMERIRVDFDNARVIQVSDENLQNKSSRYYFKKSMLLQRGDIFVSKLDLNIDNGVIEVPHKPVIRFAISVFDAKGQRRGILVLNYLAQRMLDHFDELLDGSSGNIELVNQDGYWIRSHLKEKNWGFMFDKHENFQSTYSGAWKKISSNDKGYISNNKGLFNYTTISPLSTVRDSIRFIPEFGNVIHQSDDRVWKVISSVTEDRIRKRMIDNLVHISGPVWGLLLILISVGSWRFATHHVKTQQLQLEAELHARVFAWTTEGVTITNSSGTILDVNSGFTRITGYSREEAIGQNSSILSSGRHDSAFYKAMWKDLKSNGFWDGEIFNRRKDGALYYEWLHIAAVYDHNKRLLNYIAIFSDITTKKDTEEALQRQATEDPLTGLGNRLALDTFLNQEIARTARYHNKLALLYFDLNDFKPVNDNYGHAVGDIVLREISNRLDSHARETDKVIRMGGDEFCMVLTDITDSQQLNEIERRIKKSLAQPIKTVWGNFTVGTSIGIAIFPDNASDKEALIHYADNAMYENKRKAKIEKP